MTATRCRPFENSAEITSTKLVRMFEYWSAKARGRIAPARSDINPAEIPRLLPWIWLIDVVDGGADFRFRIGGEKLFDFMGQRIAGATIAAHRENPFFASVANAFELCVSTKKPLLRPPAFSRYEQRNQVETEVLLLPLSDNGNDVSQIFGGFVIMTPLTREPDLATAAG